MNTPLVVAAQQYLEERELPSNKFTDDTELGKKLHEAGQQDGQAWCAALVEVCLKDAFPDRKDDWNKLCSLSAVQTFRNFRDAAYVIGLLPEPGWLVVWQSYKEGKAQWLGHIGIVESSNGDSWTSIEGNTSASGSREGVKVGRVAHKLTKDPVNNGLRLLGFVQIPISVHGVPL